jgi:hypothetical protein
MQRLNIDFSSRLSHDPANLASDPPENTWLKDSIAVTLSIR